MTSDEAGPYRNFRFRVRHEGRHVAGFSLIDAPPRPGAAITLERGVCHDPGFGEWVACSSRPPAGRDLDIDVFSEDGDALSSYRVRGCRVAICLSMPYVDSDAVAIRTLRLEHDGSEETTAARGAREAGGSAG